MSDRDLDRRVAEALGWRDIQVKCYAHSPAVAILVGTDPNGEVRDVPFYATAFGPWTQEMADWLQSRGWEVCIVAVHPDHAVVATATPNEGDWQPKRHGDHIPEALARLVVAVAEREREGAR